MDRTRIRAGWTGLLALTALLTGGMLPTGGTVEASVPCSEMRMRHPINEVGIYCPADPATGTGPNWKSYSLARGGPGYFIEVSDAGYGVTEMVVAYDHKAGTPSAVAVLRCYGDESCKTTYWNGHLFPFGRP